MKKPHNQPPNENFKCLEWSRQAKRDFGKRWSDKNGNPDWEKLKQILRKTPGQDTGTSQ